MLSAGAFNSVRGFHYLQFNYFPENLVKKTVPKACPPRHFDLSYKSKT